MSECCGKFRILRKEVGMLRKTRIPIKMSEFSSRNSEQKLQFWAKSRNFEEKSRIYEQKVGILNQMLEFFGKFRILSKLSVNFVKKSEFWENHEFRQNVGILRIKSEFCEKKSELWAKYRNCELNVGML